MRQIGFSATRKAEGLTLRNWDVVLGKIVRDLWAEAGLTDKSTACFRTGELIAWAVALYAEKDSSSQAISPTEHLNIEGARLARFLAGSGWRGRAYVLDTSVDDFERICGAVSSPDLTAGIEVVMRPGSTGQLWDLSLRTWT